MIQDVQKELATALSKAHDALKRELTKLRAGRANASLLDGIRVDYYGTPTPLAQMAHINVPEPRLITVKPWDKTQMKAVEKALRESDLGLNPQVDGDLVRIPLPPLTEERRKEFVKIARKYGEECKVAHPQGPPRRARHAVASSRPTARRAPTRSTAARRRSRRPSRRPSSRSTRSIAPQRKGHPRGLNRRAAQRVMARRRSACRAMTRLTPSGVGETLFSLEEFGALMRALAAGLSDVGLQREHNEDSFVVLKEYDLFVVADGMGGHRAGDVASRIATETISRVLPQSTANEDVTWPFHFDTNLSEEENRLLTGIRVANRQIFERSHPLARVPRHGHDGRRRHVQPAEAADVHRPRGRLALLPRPRRADPAADARPLAHQRLPARDARPDRRAEERAAEERHHARARACRTRSSSTSSTTIRAPGDVYVLCSDGLSGHGVRRRHRADRHERARHPRRPAASSSSARTSAGARTTSRRSSSRSKSPEPERRRRHGSTPTARRRDARRPTPPRARSDTTGT